MVVNKGNGTWSFVR